MRTRLGAVWAAVSLLWSAVASSVLAWTTTTVVRRSSPSSSSSVNYAFQQQRQQQRSSSESSPFFPLRATAMLDGKEIRGPITPVGNNIFVKIKDTLTATEGGILLPDQSKERPTEGLVLESGPGKIHPYTGVRITNPITKGMSVLFGKFDGRPVEYNGEECQVIRDDNVLLCYSGVRMKLEDVRPVRDYVLIELDERFGDQPIATKSGVVIAAQVVKDDVPCEGKVVKVGEGRMASLGDFTPSPVQPGDFVKFKDYAGNDVIIEGKPYSLVKMVDILCTLDSDE